MCTEPSLPTRCVDMAGMADWALKTETLSVCSSCVTGIFRLCTESSFLCWHKELSTHRAGPVLASCVMYRVKLSLLAQGTFHTQSRGSTLVCYEESSCCTQSQGPDPLTDNDFRSTQSYIPPPLTMIFVLHRATFPLH